MGTIVSPWRYDVAALHTPEYENTRPPAIWRCAHAVVDHVSDEAEGVWPFLAIRCGGIVAI